MPTQKNEGSLPRAEPVPVTVFCGFLGAGKTTLLRHLLAQAPTAGADGGRARWAAVVNDVAAVNIDGALVRGDAEARAAAGGASGVNADGSGAADTLAGADEIVELGNGCVCCSGADDLGEAIARLAILRRPERIWVETSGVADPRGVATLFARKNPFGQTLSDHARLHALVTVMDVVALAAEAARAETPGAGERRPVGGGDRPLFELMCEQIECADVVVLNQCDRLRSGGAGAPDETLARAEALVAGLNPRAELVRAEHGQIAAEFFLGRTRFDPRETTGAARWIRELNRVAPVAPGAPGAGGNMALAGAPRGSLVARVAARGAGGATPPPPHEAKYGLQSIVYRARAPFDAEKLNAVFARGLPGVVRAKGFFWTTRSPDEMGFLSLAGGVTRWETLSVWWAARIAHGRARMEDRPPAVVAAWAEPHGDRRQEIVLIGVRAAERAAELHAALDACLVEAKGT